VRKISPPPGFQPRTVQPVDSRYTDYATRPPLPDNKHSQKSELCVAESFDIYIWVLHQRDGSYTDDVFIKLEV
jgi:hypothetical protein